MLARIKKSLKDDGFSGVAKGSAWSIVLLGLTAAIQFMLDFSLARIAGPDILGMFYLSVTILTVMAILGRLGFDRVLIKFIAPAYKQQNWGHVSSYIRTSFKAICATGLLLSMALYFSAGFIATNIYNDERMLDILRLFSLIMIPFLLTNTIAMALRSFGRIPESIAVERLLLQLFTLCLVVSSSLIAGKDLIFISYAVATYITFIISILLLLKYAPNRARDKAKGISYGPLFSAGLYMLLVNISLQVIAWSDVLIVGYYEDTTSVGIYNVSLKISLLLSLTLTAINIPVGPKFAQLYSEKKHELLQSTFRKSAILSIALASPMLAIMIVMPGFLLSLFGPEFAAASTSLVILAIGQGINVATGSVDNLLTMTGNERVLSINLLVIMVINVALNIILIPEFGILGAAIATTLSIAIKNVASLYLVRSRLGIKLYL